MWSGENRLAAFRGSLACDLERHDSSGRRHVERVDGTVQGDPRKHIAPLT